MSSVSGIDEVTSKNFDYIIVGMSFLRFQER